MAGESLERAVWWFSGTGNSLVVARDLAQILGARLEPMARFLAEGRVQAPRGLAVLVFPVYFGALPNLVARFVASLDGAEACKLTAIATYGGGAGESFDQLNQILALRGSKLNAVYGLHLPQNAFNKFWENPAAIFRAVARRVGKMAGEIEAGRPVRSLDQAWLQPILARFRSQIRGANRRSLLAVSGLADDPTHTHHDLVAASDRSYRTNDSCNACGLCVRLCPVGNLSLETGRPVWSGRCEACLSCYHSCPRQAISGNVVQRGYFYRNPLVSPAELACQQHGGTAE